MIAMAVTGAAGMTHPMRIAVASTSAYMMADKNTKNSSSELWVAISASPSLATYTANT